ncbi:MAG: formylmethanofuran dehydrogenase subunit E family protein [Candidatus Omnitrophota bacterium]
MKYNRIRLREAIKFHGHLGPYLVLGILAGGLAVKRLKCKRYFGLYVKVRGVGKKPRSCLIDGLQLSTGATYGKGNIEKLNGSRIQMEFYNRLNQTKITLKFGDELIQRLKQAKTHNQSEKLAKQLYREKSDKLFKL